MCYYFLPLASSLIPIIVLPRVVNQATAGGGGRGMRLANEPGEFVKLLQVSFS